MEESVLALVGERLAAFRVRTGRTIENAASDAHIDTERLVDAENGEFALTENELRALADTYGIDITEFFGGSVIPINYLFGVG